MPAPEPTEVLEIDDIEVFEVLNNPTRFRILRLLKEPRSVKEVADHLGVPPTRLYYHFNMMEEANVIRVTETRKSGAMLQKFYQVTAKGFRPSPAMAHGEHEPHELAKIAAAVVLDGARIDAEEALTEHFTRVRSGIEERVGGSLRRSLAFMTRDQAIEFADRLEAMIAEEFEVHEDGDGEEYGLTVALFPLAGSIEAER
jgi:DNA-binding transcriptional ArsR family regulator